MSDMAFTNAPDFMVVSDKTFMHYFPNPGGTKHTLPEQGFWAPPGHSKPQFGPEVHVCACVCMHVCMCESDNILERAPRLM